MDTVIDYKNDKDVEKTSRTLWVGNLHPKVSNENVAELFYQVGPIEYVEFAFDEHEMSENFALVVFKYSSSVEDSIKLFHGTKLYGLPITTKNYSKYLEDPVFNDQLNYFKQLISVERDNQLGDDDNKNRWNAQNSDNKFNIPDSLPEPPMFDVCNNNPNQDNYDCRSEIKPKHKDKMSKYQYGNTKNHSIEKSHHSREFNRKSEHNASSSSMELSNQHKDSYNNKHDRKHHSYNAHTFPKWNESACHNQEPLIQSKTNSAKDILPKVLSYRSLRDTMYQKRTLSDSEYHNDTSINAGCSSFLDLRDTMNHSKKSKYDNVGQYYESNSNNQWTERRKKNTYSGTSYSAKIPHKNINNSEHYSESNNRHQNYTDRDYHDLNFNQHRSSHESYQEYDNEFLNNYNDSYTYSQEINRPNNKYNTHIRHPNMISSSQNRNSYRTYKQNDGYQKKSEYNHGRNNNKGNNEYSRHNNY